MILRTTRGILYQDFRHLCSSSDVGKIYCDGLRFSLCIDIPDVLLGTNEGLDDSRWLLEEPQVCSTELLIQELDPQTDDEIANAWQIMLNGTK